MEFIININKFKVESVNQPVQDLYGNLKTKPENSCVVVTISHTYSVTCETHQWN